MSYRSVSPARVRFEGQEKGKVVDPIEQCSKHVEAMRNIMTLGYDEVGGQPRDQPVQEKCVQMPADVNVFDAVGERIKELQEDKRKLSVTLDRQRRKQQAEIDDLRNTISVLEEGEIYLLQEHQRRVGFMREEAKETSKVNVKLMGIMEDLCRKHAALEANVHAVVTSPPPAPPSPQYIVRRSGIDWSPSTLSLYTPTKEGSPSPVAPIISRLKLPPTLTSPHSSENFNTKLESHKDYLLRKLSEPQSPSVSPVRSLY